MNGQFIKGQIPWNKGLKGVLTAWNKGKKDWMSEDAKNRMIQSKKGKPTWNKGLKGVQAPYWKGKKRSEETKLKIKQAKLGKLRGELSPNWIPDRSKLKKKDERNDVAYKEWRRSVWSRDGWKCRIRNMDCKGRLEAHHILGWTAHPELRYDINNGITLCHFHHPRKKEDEKKLSPYFKQLVAEMKII